MSWGFYLEGGWKQLINVSTMRTPTQLKTKTTLAFVCIRALHKCDCAGVFTCFIYLIFHTVSMPVCCVYIHFIAHSHQVPVNLITHLHIQTIQICIHITINGCTHRVHMFREDILRTFKWQNILLYPKYSSFFVYVYLTMHLVALYKGFIILQVRARVPDVGPDVFIQIPGLLKKKKSQWQLLRGLQTTLLSTETLFFFLPALILIKNQEKQCKLFYFLPHTKSPGSSL